MYYIYFITLSFIIFSKCLIAFPNNNVVETPKNIITLEHRYTEMILSLGLVPKGVADIFSYQNYDGVYSNKLNNIRDVGKRSLPSITTITTLKPDLIIGANFRNIQAFKILNKIAPTVLFDYIDTSNYNGSSLSSMFHEFKAVAKLVNKSSKAKDIINEFNQDLFNLHKKIALLKANKDLTNDRIAIAQFLPGSSKIRLFTTDSVSMELMTKLGLKPAWDVSSGYTGMGYRTVSFSTLQQLGKFNFFYFNERSDDTQLKKIFASNIWKSFDFVKAGLVYELNKDTWPWGGPISSEKLMQQVVNKLDQGNNHVNKQKS
jgi:iron complex transport system substrate-binding protein